MPPPADAHVPSPRQNVLLDAEVPELRLVTGRLPVTPVVSGKPVAFVNVSVGPVANTLLPVPVLVTLTKFLLPSVATAEDALRVEFVIFPVTVRLPSVPTVVSDDVTTPDASVVPVMPEAGVEVAAIVPAPVAANDEPEPTTIAAVVLVPEVNALNADEPPPGVCHVAAVPLVAVKTCPEVGAVADETFTIVVADARAAVVVAPIVPEPVTARDAPLPTIISACVLVDPVKALKAVEAVLLAVIV